MAASRRLFEDSWNFRAFKLVNKARNVLQYATSTYNSFPTEWSRVSRPFDYFAVKFPLVFNSTNENPETTVVFP